MSIPDINPDIQAANNRFDEAYGPSRYRNFKSCPTTPRATTPTRTLSRSRIGDSEVDQSDYISTDAVISRSTYSRGSYIPSPSVPHSGYQSSICGQTFPEDDRYSFESRSLTAYSNYSERDSVIDSNYRYPYAREPTYNNQYILSKSNERPNPLNLQHNTQVDANNIVNLFLQKSIFPSVTNNINNNCIGSSDTNSSGVHQSYSEANSTVSPVSDDTSELSKSVYNSRAAIAQLKKEFLAREPEKPTLNRPKRNKYLSNRNSSVEPNVSEQSETPSSLVTSPVASVASSTPVASVPIVQLESEPERLNINIISSRAEEFGIDTVTSVTTPVGDQREDPVLCTDKTLTCDTDTGHTGPVKPSPLPPTQTGSEQDQLQELNDKTTVRAAMEPFFLSDTVKSEDIPRLHHAEICNVRRDTTSESDECQSNSSEEEEQDSSLRNIMVNINPIQNTGSQQPTTSPVKLDAPPTRQNIWGPSPRHSQQHDYVDMGHIGQTGAHQCSDQNGDNVEQIFSHSASTFYPQANTNIIEELHLEPVRLKIEETLMLSPTQPNRTVSFENALDSETDIAFKNMKGEGEDEPILSEQERSFQDPAFSNFVDSQKEKPMTQESKQKKKGFLSSLFKKSNKKQLPYGDDFIHIERKDVREDESENETDSNLQDLLDQSPRQRCKWDYWGIMLVVFKNKMKLFLGSLELKEIFFSHYLIHPLQ